MAQTRARFLLGVNFYDSEEVSQGEKLLSDVFPRLKGRAERGSCHEELMACLNYLGMIWSSRDEMSKAESYLQEAHQAYLAQSKPSALAEKQFTTTLFLLAQVNPLLAKNEIRRLIPSSCSFSGLPASR